MGNAVHLQKSRSSQSSGGQLQNSFVCVVGKQLNAHSVKCAEKALLTTGLQMAARNAATTIELLAKIP